MQKNELIKLLRDQLQRHDWNFYTADPIFKEAGERQWNAIRKTKLDLVAKGVSLSEIAKIHNEYAPEEHKLNEEV